MTTIRPFEKYRFRYTLNHRVSELKPIEIDKKIKSKKK